VLAASAETFADPAIRAALGETGTVAVVLREGAIGASGFVDGFEHVRLDSDYRALPDGAVEILTSGTTGEPKRIAHSVATVEKAAMSEIGVMADVEAHVEPQRRNAPFVMPYPISTAASFHLFHSVVSGRCVVLMEKFKLQGWIRAMQKHRPPAAYVPPAGVRMLLEAELPAQAFAGTLVIRTGGAPLEREAIIRLQDKYGLRVTPQYGATEYCGVVTWWPMVEAEQFHRVKLGSVGRARPDAALRIVSAQSGEPLPVGEIGLLEVQVARVGAGWMRSTDLASIDEDGFLFIRGRADDAINRGGFKILPEPLADVLRLHPAVRDAAVVGLPDARLGEVPVAAVELRDGVPAPSEAELFAHLRRHVPAFQVPVKIRIVAALPRNAMQKVVRTQVRELF
jgi:long-chain acyl-CoA synthetase